VEHRRQACIYLPGVTPVIRKGTDLSSSNAIQLFSFKDIIKHAYE
jgi:hypothetical protein